jgi:hypothetical protein
LKPFGGEVVFEHLPGILLGRQPLCARLGGEYSRLLLGQIERDWAALGGPSGITVAEARTEFGKCGVPDLRDAALVYAELPCNVTVLPVEVERQRNDSILPI